MPMQLSAFTNARDTAPVWPLPILNGNVPTVIDRGVRTPGVHLTYENAALVPRLIPIFSVADGEIVYAGKQSAGYCVVVDHLNGWASYYNNLEHMFARPRAETKRGKLERVKAGDVLGFVDLKNERSEKGLYFELWTRGEESLFTTTNVNDHIYHWALLPWSDEHTNRKPVTIPVAA